MEEKKFDEVMTELRTMGDQLKQDREAFAAEQRAFEQEKATYNANPEVKRDREVTWKCRNCGYIFKGKEAPVECPACGHEQSWYEMQEILE